MTSHNLCPYLLFSPSCVMCPRLPSLSPIPSLLLAPRSTQAHAGTGTRRHTQPLRVVNSLNAVVVGYSTRSVLQSVAGLVKVLGGMLVSGVLLQLVLGGSIQPMVGRQTGNMRATRPLLLSTATATFYCINMCLTDINICADCEEL